MNPPLRGMLRSALLVTVVTAAGCAQLGNSMLEFSPASFSDCEITNIVVNVRWDATSKTDEPVTLLVYKPGKKPVAWMADLAPKGEADTGKWMSDGSTMRLVDAHGRVLAMRTMQTTACAD